MSEATATVETPPAKPSRPVAVIHAELTKLRAEYKTLEAKTRNYYYSRLAQKKRVEALIAEWRIRTGQVGDAANLTKDQKFDPLAGQGSGDFGLDVGGSFDPNAYNPPAVIPPEDTADTRRFHAIHEEIARLEAELVKAKLHAVGK